jgi:hypothetical protein
MYIGYPCINRSIGFTASRTFRLSRPARKGAIAALALARDEPRLVNKILPMRDLISIPRPHFRHRCIS